MIEAILTREERAVRVQTVHGAIRGALRIGPKIRTLDELNLASHKFLRIESAELELRGSTFEPGPLGINKDAILFVTETATCSAITDLRVERSHFVRSAVRLRLGEFDIQGFLHLRGMRDPLVWVSQSRQPFLALTAASVVGPDVEFATPFIAINPQHVLAAQGLRIETESPEAAVEPAVLRLESC